MPTSIQVPSAGAAVPDASRRGFLDQAWRGIMRARRASVAARARSADVNAQATLERHARRLARGLAHVINIFDPDVIVLGGGLSKLAHLYDVLPKLTAPHVFAAPAHVVIKPPAWGDAGGVRGAAWLWD
jgi:fructokinase